MKRRSLTITAGRRRRSKRARSKLSVVWFVVRTFPLFVRECLRMGWARFRKRAYVAPRDRGQRPEAGGRKGFRYRPHPGRFGAVVNFPGSRSRYFVGRGGNLVNPERRARKARRVQKTEDRGQRGARA